MFIFTDIFIITVSPDMLVIFTDIINKVEKNTTGVTQIGLKKFLFALVVLAHMYPFVFLLYFDISLMSEIQEDIQNKDYLE